MSTQPSALIRAAQSENILDAALAYQHLGFSVLPLKGKRPSCTDWKQYQQAAASAEDIRKWHLEGLLQNIGVVCGAVSDNLVVLDLDGAAGYPAFAATFPALAETYTVKTGGGIGKHVYWRVDRLPDAIKAMNTPVGNIEICAEGRQIVVPPSKHPRTGKYYQIAEAVPLLHMPDLEALVQWVDSFRLKIQAQHLTISSHTLNPEIVAALTRHFTNQGYLVRGEWLHGRCVFPHRHTHGDRHPSFGYNIASGLGHCYKCGTILTKDLCAVVGIDPASFGGLLKKHTSSHVSDDIRLSDSPALPRNSGGIQPPSGELVLENLKLPRWLQMYLDWAGATGNETPASFHLFAGLWLAAAAVGRRLCAEAPWGQTIYPNLYILMVAVSTFYRKSTAYRLAEQVAQQTFPHLMLPTPGSPERLLSSLAGILPSNFKELSQQQQEQLRQSRAFAAQRALRIDEIAGLLSAVNKRDYMISMKDHLLEIYDCPPVLTRDTQAGLTIIERPVLSIFGLTTPAALANAVGFRDWMDGLFPRFLLVSPEKNYRERPAQQTRLPIPAYVLEGLHQLYAHLPVPPDPAADAPLERELPAQQERLLLEWEVQVECWAECRAYGEQLRQFCNPNQDSDIEERLRPTYGRLHVQALKIAILFAALRWIDEATTPVPIVTQEDWHTAESLAEYLRASTNDLIGLLDRSGEAMREQSLQDRMVEVFAMGGAAGRTLRDVYRQLHLPAKAARQMADDLVLAGLLVKTIINGAEGYIARLSQPETSL